MTSANLPHHAAMLGMTHSATRIGVKGERIHYTIRHTSLGLMIMAATEHGLCLLEFADSNVELIQRLQQGFPDAELMAFPSHQPGKLDEWIAAMEGYLGGTAPRPDLPMDLRGTAFQVAVWRFLVTIPRGRTITYTELATGIERPRAVRAAASACAANKIAILVPCHRIIRGDGGLGGYRWGIARKTRILDLERIQLPLYR